MFDSLLEKVALALDSERLPYMVIGGQAVLLHGEPRLTKDVDITLAAGLDELDTVLRSAKEAGLEPLVDGGLDVGSAEVSGCPGAEGPGGRIAVRRQGEGREGQGAEAAREGNATAKASNKIESRIHTDSIDNLQLTINNIYYGSIKVRGAFRGS